MTATVKPIPDGYTAITPYLIVDGAAEAIDFYGRAFGAEEMFRMPMPDGQTIMHAEIRVGGDVIMLTDASPQCDSKSPKTLGGTAVSLHLYVDDADAAFARAVDAGCEITMPLTDMFWGDRFGRLSDPYGHSWSIATHVADKTPEEVAAGAKAAFAAAAG
jgi:uncharacterized glyoxalase superfamily protein PhnB